LQIWIRELQKAEQNARSKNRGRQRVRGARFAQAICDLNLPSYMSKIVNIGIQQNQPDYILKTGLIILLIALLGGLATILVGLLSSRIATGAARNLRKDVFHKIESFSLSMSRSKRILAFSVNMHCFLENIY